MTKVWARIRETIERHGTAAMLSVVGSAGSVPRDPGARIVLQPNGGFFGSIGGGSLEYEALAAVREVLAAGRGKAQFRDWPLGPNLGQCCGGLVTTLAETFDRTDLAMVRRLEEAENAGVLITVSRRGEDGRITRTLASQTPKVREGNRTAATLTKTSFREQFGEAVTSILLFGAGHVGRALVLALAPLPFAVRWIDSRPDQFPQYVPQNVTAVCGSTPQRELDAAAPGCFVVIMTHSHPLDFEIAASALQQEKVSFVGLIGSETKRARFAGFARKLGLADGAIERLVCPIGLPQISGKAPAVIAAAVAAQLLIVCEKLTVPMADGTAQLE